MKKRIEARIFQLLSRRLITLYIITTQSDKLSPFTKQMKIVIS